MTLPIPDRLSAPLDCAAVDARLADYLDDGAPPALPAAERAAVTAHLADCVRCGPLVADLRALSAHAAALPALRPSHDLWPAISARLDPASAAPESADARVLPFRAAHPALRQPVARRWLAAAAVALVTLSSGTTYFATRQPTPRPTDVAAAPERPSVAAPRALESAGEGRPSPATGADTDDGTARPPASDPLTRTTARTPRELAPGPAEPRVRAVAHSVDETVPGAADYDREIAALRAVVAERGGELDSSTVAVLARNLRVIDAAIAASRAALARDPHSPFLGDQLTRALGQKVELLRTATLLPRT